MKIKFLKAWKRHKIGDTIVEADGVANVLIGRGIAENVEGNTVDRADKRPSKRTRNSNRSKTASRTKRNDV